jgi:hypothetical protein
MSRLVDVLTGLAVLALLVAVGFRFLSPNLGFSLLQSFVTPLFLWRVAMGLLGHSGGACVEADSRQVRTESAAVR